MAVYLAIAVAYLIGGLWSILAYRYSARVQGYALNGPLLAILAFVLWPLIALQIIFVSIHAYQRNRIARLKGRV